ncbi:substrate-binding domain-containing protein [Cohnella algarum]|uniref:substrate-binding domain-containing protein n=1 Tax=Cohnella algarum TaxID=2044859 RepID=UPI001968347F|nr:helix-turn-helix transcriptional regulator [Cohnella algarum]MBN2984051.1 helix-turn-helix transcriptional regulator [Cohnella algarum]
MTSDTSYTTEEVAKLLKISKLTVYDLIKKGELPSYKVGKQMRVDASDLEAYKRKAKGKMSGSVQPSPDNAARSIPAASAAGRPFVITGQDVSLDILANYLEKRGEFGRPLRSYAGSLDSLIAMYRGEADIVSTHLLDGDTGEYNLPYIRKILTGFSYIVVHLLVRNAGFYVRAGNPLKIENWDDLGRPGLRIANREKGSGARVLLDEQLRLRGISPGAVAGYGDEQTNHIGVAGKVSSGDADVGVGAEKAAAIVGQVDFIPLIRERYDLVALKTPENESRIAALLSILRSDAFRQELGAISGYDLSLTGTILFET